MKTGLLTLQGPTVGLRQLGAGEQRGREDATDRQCETGTNRKVDYYVQLSVRVRNQKLFIEEAEIQIGLKRLMRFKT